MSTHAQNYKRATGGHEVDREAFIELYRDYLGWEERALFWKAAEREVHEELDALRLKLRDAENGLAGARETIRALKEDLVVEQFQPPAPRRGNVTALYRRVTELERKVEKLDWRTS